MATQEKPPVVQELLQANEKYKNSFTNGDLPLPPAKKVAVLACMDARLDPARALGLEEGDAHVIRNAGGRAKDALRSLIISQILLGTKHVVILHHTDCGMRTFSNADIQAKIKERDGHESDIPDFLPYPDDEWGVREDIQLIRDSPHVPKDVTVHGVQRMHALQPAPPMSDRDTGGPSVQIACKRVAFVVKFSKTSPWDFRNCCNGY
ncbi:carbonic anhydrase [Klebsormidium nitens]|uniref:Carbonic anhydrase n=1 Tax=Klebsormidium nitens TaxID=105231 RepID=A0A1Y1HZG7_KLENI|nr:carbonic anhydrase [Klebsormidium nitens]|eukprot:GAQ84045.1 carbonic anhydrase [Klebsormidium nitens]